jgi:hypothetical protein
MLTAPAPEVLTDPIALLVNLVVRQEPSLDRATVTEVVENLAGGRAKRRRLAQALLDRPSVLQDGRSRRLERLRTCSSRCAKPARRESRRQSAQSAASSCAPSNTAVSTGTAESAGRRGNPARHAATSGPSAAVIANNDPDARTARPTTGVTPWI